MPYQKTLFRYSRNVDPKTGRPRWGMTTGICKTGRESSCLTEDNALTHHSINQQLFHMICATSIGFSDLDSGACGQTVFNSQKLSVEPFLPDGSPNPDWVGVEPRVMIALTNILSGQPGTGPQVIAGVGDFTATTLAAIANYTGGGSILVPLLRDPEDGQMLAQAPGGGPDSAPWEIPPHLRAEQINSILFWTFGGIQRWLTDEQEALLGCGPFYGTLCDLHGVDLMNAEATAIMQSFPGFPGTSGDHWDTRDRRVAQPGTVGFQGGPVCTRYENGKTFILPGCRGPGDRGYDRRVDGSTGGSLHPFTGQEWRSEMAIVSWNTLMGLVAFSSPALEGKFLITDFDPDRPFRTDGCSFAEPQFCRNVQSFFQISGIQRNTMRAGGNWRFGRRDWTWAGGKEIALRYERRNIVGFGMDFAEDFTKSNWGVEFTWENDILLGDNDRIDGLSEVDRFNLTVSVDRPTFINFLNANRTFFINTQWFVQYVDGYRKAFPSNGPWNVLAVLAVNTGFFDDRLLPSMSIVYDFGSNSGAWLPQITYRYSANFSVTFGLAAFMGREEARRMAISPTSLSNRTGRHAYKDFAENGLGAVRDRDEMFLKVRYTF